VSRVSATKAPFSTLRVRNAHQPALGDARADMIKGGAVCPQCWQTPCVVVSLGRRREGLASAHRCPSPDAPRRSLRETLNNVACWATWRLGRVFKDSWSRGGGFSRQNFKVDSE
jgi:hypothetical protein